MDNLEKFIKGNRDELDKYDPSPEIWYRIIKAVKPGGRSVRFWISAAAMIIVVVGTAFILLMISQKKNPGFNTDKNIQPALKETEIYYNTLVNLLYREASPLLTGQPEIEKELKTDMAQIDSICVDIKKDLKDNVANQEVIEALIQNYRIKIRLLEDMVNLLKQNEVEKDKNTSYEL
jgi:flagellar motor component MotA